MADTVKGLLQYMIDNGIPITATVADIISVEQSDKSKLKGTMELSAGIAVIGKVGLQVAGNDVSSSNPINTDVKNVLDAGMGNLGGVYSGEATITPDSGYVFNAVQIITDAVLTCTGSPSGITTITFTAGTIIYGRFTQVVIASGSVIAYQGK